MSWIGQTPEWIAATAATIAAVASVAVWRQSIGPAWKVEFDGQSKGSGKLVNRGQGRARSVQVRQGSAADVRAGRRDIIERSEVRPGEAIPFVNVRALSDPTDYSLNVTWRSAFWGRKRTWSYPL